MHLLRDTSISRKLKLVIMLTTSIALLVACAAFVANDLMSLRKTMMRDLHVLADILVAEETAALTFNDPVAAAEDLNALKANPHIVSACFYTKDGELFADYVRSDQPGNLTLPAIKPDGTYWENDRLVVFHRVMLENEAIGALYIESDLREMSDRSRRYFWIVAVIILAALGAAYLLSSSLQRVISGPISHLARTVRAVSVEKDYAIRAVRTGRDEMGMLIDGFNEMLDQIQERDSQLQEARDKLERGVEERTKELQQEVAERKQAVELLRHSEEHFRSLIENASDIITVVDLDGTIRYESPSVERVLGYKPRELVGRNASDFIHPDDTSATSILRAGVGDAYNGPVSVEVRFKHKEGDWRTLEVSGKLLRDGPGAEQIIINSRDITERKIAEQTLRESEEVFRSLAETVSAAIYIYRGSKFIYVNPAAETITGYTHEELMEMEVWSILHPNSVEEARKTSALRQNGEDVPAHSEANILTKNGETRWLDITPRLIRFQGEQAILATAFDVTDRKGWEDSLRESEEKYRTILENIQEGYYEVDLAGSLTFYNDSLCRIVGSSRERLMGLNNREYTAAGTSGKLYEAFNQVFRSGEPLEEFQYEIVTRDGVQKSLETSILLRRDQAGQISGFRGTLRDITERKRSEEALRGSEERYRLLFERNLAGVYRATTDGVVLDCNEAAARILGYSSKEDAISRSMWEFYYDLSEREALVQRLFKERTISNLESRARTKAGDAIWILVNLSLIDGPDGAPAAIEGTLIDITARKHAEEALRESEQRYKTLFDAATDGIVILSTEGENAGLILAANKATAESTGYTVDELLTLNISDLLTPEYRHLVEHSALPRVAADSITVEVLRRRKDGTTFPVEINASPLRIGDENYILGFARDITERKHIEKEVTMLAQAIRSIRESVCITDSEDAVLFINDAFLTTYGYERHEIIGKNIFDLVRLPANSGEDTSAIPPPDQIRRWEGELVNRRKDGSKFPIHLSSSPIVDENGRIIALIGVIQDITESKSAIEELQNAKDAAETASRAKSEFLANMSHEIRTPMNGIIGMTDLALDTDLTAEQREYLKMVKLSADSLLGVINDVLDFSKIEAGKLELDQAEFNLQDTVDEVMKALAVRADQKSLELAYYLRLGVPEKVVGDAGRLRQILVNLVGNAIKFTEQGEVIVRVDAQAATSDEVVLHFSVRDTGIGVPPEKQTMIFESFTQADGSTTRKYGGTGLGLSISSQLVQMMGGEIWVESPVILPPSTGTPGSRFNFTGTFGLPLDSVTTARKPAILELRDLPVLVVDDNATNRKILEVQLASWQMKPVLVDGARSALQALRQAATVGAPFKLALLDFHMPEMDGLALAEEIRSLPECRGLRIIMMSSSVQRTHTSQDGGIDASLLKPVSASELLSVIRSVLGDDVGSQKSQMPARRTSLYPSRILVAEDSTVNQELIRRLLEKWGHNAVLAEDGQKALSLFETEEFDLVLMDLQMPEMNGFEVTEAIRKQEQGTANRIPIIALTAHALKGDRERCIAAGMDDYVSKPVDAAQLFEMLERIARRRLNADNETAPAALDLDGLMRNFDGDAELVLKLARIFDDSSVGQVRQIGDAISRGDADALARGAHLLKGAVANFGARAAVDAAVRLESIARGGDLSIAGSALVALEREIDRLKFELQMFEQASVAG